MITSPYATVKSLFQFGGYHFEGKSRGQDYLGNAIHFAVNADRRWQLAIRKIDNSPPDINNGNGEL